MKIAFIENPLDHSNLKNPFGVSTFIIESLRECGAVVIPISADPIPLKVNFYKLKARLLKLIGINYLYSREPNVLKAISERIENRIEKLDIDAIISFGTLPMAFLKTNKPKFIWTDALFNNLIDYYGDYKNLSNKSIEQAEFIEKKALREATSIFFPTSFPLTKISKYLVNTQKVHIASFGANHKIQFNEKEIEEIIRKKSTDKVRLLFVGYKWEGKGADITVKIAEELNKRNISVQLDIVGFEKRKEINHDFIKFHGKLNKLNEKENKHLSNLFENAHFLMLLSKFECFGHVISEANSYGLPAITSNTGGLNEVVEENINGVKFERPEFINPIVDYIVNMMNNESEYRNLCIKSYQESVKRLNWKIGAQKVFNEISKIIN